MPALVSCPYRPSSTLSGNEGMAILRGANMKLRGRPGDLYYEAYSGSLDLEEPLPATALTGTLAFSPASDIVTGTGTNFLAELHPQQMLQANTEPLVVTQIISATQFRTGRRPFTTETAASAVKKRNLFALDVKRASLSHGNAILTDRGNILCVGNDALYVNGAVLPGDSLIATRRLQVALYESVTTTYDVQDVGFFVSPITANTDVTVLTSGGVKNMSLGYYSFQIAYYTTDSPVATETGVVGFGNPGATLLSGGTAGYQIAGANYLFQIDFTSDVANRPAHANGYIIYGTAYGTSSADSQRNAIQGPHFEVTHVAFTDLTAGDLFTFEYVDSDLVNGIVSFDNDPPSDAEFIGSLDMYPFLLSTNGQGVNVAGREASSSPGAFVSPIKATNFDAYPFTAKVPTEKGEVIIGAISAAGRIFVLTSNTLQAVSATGIPSAPFTCRPFWKKGFQGQYNVILSGDTLYGFTSAGVFRSIAEGDAGQASNDFAASVEAQMADWAGAFVFVEEDLKNEEVCFIYSAAYQNEQGYWVSEVYPYSKRQNDWVTPVILSDPTRDMIVSGVASVNGHLEFVAGGRREGTTYQDDTWRYDAGSGMDVPYYLAFTYADDGVELTPKLVAQFRPKGKFTDAKVQIYATTPDTDVDVADLVTGANPTLEFDLDDSTTVKQYQIFKRRVKNALMWTARIEGVSNWDGDPNTQRDQFHELAYAVNVVGGMK